MKRSLLVAVAVALWPAASVLAQGTAADPAKPDLAKAQTIVNQVCAACHGTDGNSPSPANPNLAGLPAEYITGQLAHFKSGIRANPVMLGMSAALSPADMTALGAYYSQQKPKGLERQGSRAGEGRDRRSIAVATRPAASPPAPRVTAPTAPAFPRTTRGLRASTATTPTRS